MKPETILKKAIEKAVKNGCVWKSKEDLTEDYCKTLIRDNYFLIVIFSHDFAKAFWGDGECEGFTPCWKHHLIRMVLEQYPIKYLEKFIDNSGVGRKDS